MNYKSVKEIAEQWGVTPTMVRRYCVEGRLPTAVCNDGAWLIPAGTRKPKRKPVSKPLVEELKLPPLAKRVIYQRGKNNHFGVYEYIQVNLTYSSNRMASNRLTRTAVEELYRTGKITTTFEPAKADDIIEVLNHFAAVRLLIDHLADPLAAERVSELHRQLTYGTFADRKATLRPGEFRTARCATSLGTLLREYDKGPKDTEHILDLHVRFRALRPFEDYNGRLARLLMLRECLRHGVDPFVIDDKHRGEYHRALDAWSTDHAPLLALAVEFQERFQSKMELFKLFQYNRF